MSLEQTIADGYGTLHPVHNRWSVDRTNMVVCHDGFEMSVVAGPGAYCTPRPVTLASIEPDGLFAEVPYEYPGPYSHVEVGFPSQRPEPWEPVDGEECWSKYAEEPDWPTETVYGYVPVALVRHLVALHGGETG